MKKIKLLFALILITTANSFAQENNVEMADGLYENGKIFIVVISVLIILVGLLLYLIGLDRKVSRIERELKENNH